MLGAGSLRKWFFPQYFLLCCQIIFPNIHASPLFKTLNGKSSNIIYNAFNLCFYLFLQVFTTLLTLYHFGLCADFQICHISNMSGPSYNIYFNFLFHLQFNTDMCLRIFAVLGVGFLPHFHPNWYATSYITFSSNCALLKVPSLNYSLLELYHQLTTYHIML